MNDDIELGYEKKVLDHGHVKLIEWMGTDETIVAAARQSTGKGFISWSRYWRCDTCEIAQFHEPIAGSANQRAGAENCSKHKMIEYPNGDMGILDTLMRQNHSTPFEMGELIIEVKAPIMVFREWHRHRTQSYNEMSARYVQMPNEHYLPEASRIQKQSQHSKQGSAEAMDQTFAMKVIADLGDQQKIVYDSYDEWVEEGLAKEVARLNTPVARYSQMWAKTDVLNWLKFLNLRIRPAAQYEIRQYAQVVADILKARWPRTFHLFEEYQLYACRFSRTEMAALRQLIGMIELPDGPTPEDVILDCAEKAGVKGTRKREFLTKILDGGSKLIANP